MAFSWPFTSAKSTSYKSSCSSNAFWVSKRAGDKVLFPLKKSTTSLIFSMPYTSIPSTIAASSAFCEGNKKPLKPSFFACMAIGNAPFMGCKEPSKLNSPIITNSSSWSASICPDAAKIPIARGKSKLLPSFLISAGAMLIVIFLPGNFRLEFFSAASILFWLSFTALSGKPTKKNLKPLSIFTSMVIVVASIP